jgi:ABC-type cobalamin/Fe3+-siderophores transport system ATPase subunit
MKPQEVITAENIKAVYGAEGCVYAHPLNGGCLEFPDAPEFVFSAKVPKIISHENICKLPGGTE